MCFTNDVRLIGYCAAKPKLKNTKTGNNMAILVVYAGDYVGNNNYVSQSHRCLIFGRKAQIIVRKADKGKHIYIRGMIRSQRVGEGSDSHYYTSVIVEDFQFTPVQSMFALKDTMWTVKVFSRMNFYKFLKNLCFLNCQ